MAITLTFGATMVTALPNCKGDEIPAWTNCFGTQMWENGDKYVGEFKNGKQDGQGTLTFSSGSTYVGEFKVGKRHGQAVYTHFNGTKYVGEYRDDKQNGKGTATYSDGSTYVGGFKNSKRNGKGTWTYANGNKYLGEAKNGLKHGQGTFIWSNRAKYIGEWKDDYQNGQGTFTWPDGSKYVGEWRGGPRHGRGIMNWPDGSKYVGDYREDKMAGQGILTLSNGQVQEGVFKNNIFQYAQKTPYSIKPTFLKVLFVKLPKDNRLKLQSKLKELGFYNSKIDGLYGKATAAALVEYNKKHLRGSNLKVSENVKNLFDAVLALGTTTETTAGSDVKLFKQIKEEFGLSFYGGFIHSERVPNALFFFSDIRKDDSFEFRKALRTHDTDLIVLSSPGGSVNEGLQTAGIIHDKNLKTYIPKESLYGSGNCASACSFMFFAGESRSAEGALGVHQFYSGKASDEAKIGATQKKAQFTVSEIIGFLNEFKTPPWVFERMFQQKEMYYFKESELLQLETEVSEETTAQHEKAERFISDFRSAFVKIKD